jgi:hypothetical protein
VLITWEKGRHRVTGRRHNPRSQIRLNSSN